MLPSAAGAAGASLAQAQQGYPVPPARSIRPIRPAGGYPVDIAGPGAPDFDALEDDEAPNAQSSTALPPPGPVLSPNDPRYGRPMGAPPVYSDRGVPTGPVMSPDDPRYGRPAGPPPVIYSDRRRWRPSAGRRRRCVRPVASPARSSSAPDRRRWQADGDVGAARR